MVRNQPEFNLSDVRKAAKSGHVSLSREAEKHRLNLEYSVDDFHRCITEINETEYVKTFEYEGDLPLDTYKTRFKKPGKDTSDFLYIKLRLYSDNQLEVEVCSFKLV